MSTVAFILGRQHRQALEVECSMSKQAAPYRGAVKATGKCEESRWPGYSIPPAGWTLLYLGLPGSSLVGWLVG